MMSSVIDFKIESFFSRSLPSMMNRTPHLHYTRIGMRQAVLGQEVLTPSYRERMGGVTPQPAAVLAQNSGTQVEGDHFHPDILSYRYDFPVSCSKIFSAPLLPTAEGRKQNRIFIPWR